MNQDQLKIKLAKVLLFNPELADDSKHIERMMATPLFKVVWQFIEELLTEIGK